MENLIESISKSIDSLPQEFTTHQLVIELAKNNQHAYIDALHNHLESNTPFQTLHAKIGKYLSKKVDSISPVDSGPISDKDIFGHASSNALWKKLT